MRTQHFRIRTPHIVDCHCCCSAGTPVASTDAARNDRREVAGMANFKMYLLRQFRSNRVEFFLQYTGDIDAKNDGQNFENFSKFSQRSRAVPLRPIWTIMVVAKLDHSGVDLVTKFRQNRSTLNGRSAGQRLTDRHTHIQTDRQTHRLTDKLGWQQWPFRFAIGPIECIEGARLPLLQSWRRQLWSSGGRAPSTSNNLFFFQFTLIYLHVLFSRPTTTQVKLAKSVSDMTS